MTSEIGPFNEQVIAHQEIQERTLVRMKEDRTVFFKLSNQSADNVFSVHV